MLTGRGIARCLLIAGKVQAIDSQIFPGEGCYPREFGNVVCDQAKVSSNRNRGDLQVTRANALPQAFQIVPDLCVFVGGSIVEWESREGRQEHLNAGLLLGWILTSRGAIQQLRANDCSPEHEAGAPGSPAANYGTR